MPSSIVFRLATVIEGEEDSTPYIADVIIVDGLISKIGANLEVPKDVRTIDAKGYILCPGFIDMHAHSDLYLITHPEHEAKISQGCTTEVVGQDGISYYPTRNPHELTSIRSQIAGWNGNPSDLDCSTIYSGRGLFEWNDIRGYLDCLDKNKIATNVAVLVPQGNLRLLACGPRKVIAADDEVKDQVVLLREGMEQGAIGMSSGLTYTPGMYASNSELGRLCTVLNEEYEGAYYAPHHRSYGHKAMESYEEMLNLSRTTGCPVHLTHATLNFPENAGRAPELLSRIQDARTEGCDITLDTYPYLPGCTTLAALLPSWASSGGPSETLERLEDVLLREKIRLAVEVEGCDGGHGIPTDWRVIQIGSTSHPDLKSYDGQTISQIALSQNVAPIQIFFDILIKDKLATSILMHIGNEENVRAIMMDEQHCGGSDAILHGETTHPRAYGTFPRFISHYSRNLGLLPLSQMVAHLTSRPAKRIGIYPHRGLIAVGSAADIVLFDPEAIEDMATFEQPKLKAKGIRFVLVNGEIAVDEGECTGVRGGKTLRRGRDGKVSSDPTL